jgi:hypothetical protein
MELLGRELGTHWADFGNVKPKPNRTMPWSGRRLLSTRLPTRAQWYHWSHFDPKPTLREDQAHSIGIPLMAIQLWLSSLWTSALPSTGVRGYPGYSGAPGYHQPTDIIADLRRRVTPLPGHGSFHSRAETATPPDMAVPIARHQGSPPSMRPAGPPSFWHRWGTS